MLLNPNVLGLPQLFLAVQTFTLLTTESLEFLVLASNYLIYAFLHSCTDLVYRPLAMMNEPLMYLRQYAEILMGSKLAAQYLLTALAAKTYSWKEDHAIPMCTVPVAFTNVKDSRSIIESIRMLMPMVFSRDFIYRIFSNKRPGRLVFN